MHIEEYFAFKFRENKYIQRNNSWKKCYCNKQMKRNQKALQHLKRAAFYMKHSESKNTNLRFGAMFTTRGKKQYNVTTVLSDAYKKHLGHTLYALCDIMKLFTPRMKDWKRVMPDVEKKEEILRKLERMTILFEDLQATMLYYVDMGDEEPLATSDSTIQHHNGNAFEKLSFRNVAELMKEMVSGKLPDLPDDDGEVEYVHYIPALQSIIDATLGHMQTHSTPYSSQARDSVNTILTAVETLITRVNMVGKKLKLSQEHHGGSSQQNLDRIQFGQLFECMFSANSRLATRILTHCLDGICTEIKHPNLYIGAIALNTYQLPAVEQRLVNLKEGLNDVLHYMQDKRSPSQVHLIRQEHRNMTMDSEVECNIKNIPSFKVSFEQFQTFVYDKARGDLSNGIAFLCMAVEKIHEFQRYPSVGGATPQKEREDQMAIRGMLHKVQKISSFANGRVSARLPDLPDLPDDDDEVEYVRTSTLVDRERQARDSALDLVADDDDSQNDVEDNDYGREGRSRDQLSRYLRSQTPNEGDVQLVLGFLNSQGRWSYQAAMELLRSLQSFGR